MTDEVIGGDEDLLERTWLETCDGDGRSRIRKVFINA